MSLPEGFEWRVDFDPAFDKRAAGLGGMRTGQFRFAVVGPAGAVSWLLFTGWSVDSVRDPYHTPSYPPMPAMLVGHARVTPESKMVADCEYFGSCVELGHLLGTHECYTALVLHGFAGVQELLLKRYREFFAGVQPS